MGMASKQAQFDDCEVSVGPDTTTLLRELPDQGALHGLIQRIADFGLELIDVRSWHRLLTSAMRLPHASSSIRVSKRNDNDDDRGNQLSRTRPLTAR